MHKRSLSLVITTLVVLASAATAARAGDVGPPLHQPLPEFVLPVPGDAVKRGYLNLADAQKTFTIGQLQADAVMIEIFSMYCPFCQREAPRVNALFDLIQSDPQLRGRIKMIGIGVGNSAYEVDYFRKSYNIAFPLFPDEDFRIHKQFGEVRTPFFVGVRTGTEGKSMVVLTHSGGFPSPRDFLNQFLESAGIRGEK